MSALTLSRRALALGALAAPAAAQATPTPLTAGGWVYVFVVEGVALAKIGYSRNPMERCRRMTADTGLPLRLAYVTPRTPGLEGALHARFAAQRISREWVRIEGAFETWLRAQR